MSSVIQNMLSGVLGDGARSTKFECFVDMTFNGLYANPKNIVALTKTSQFPGKTHDVIDLKFKGRTIPIKGQVKYDNTWSCTFYLTQDHELKKVFEDWVEALDQKHNMSEGTNGSGVVLAQKNHAAGGYVTEMLIKQLNFEGDQPTAVYELHNVFPKSVSSIEVDYSAVGTVLEFTVEFSYSHYDLRVQKTSSGTFVDELAGKVQGAIEDSVNNVRSGLANVVGSAAGKAKAAGKAALSNSLRGTSDASVASPSDMMSRLE